VLEPYDGKLSRTVLRGEGGEIPLTYPVCDTKSYYIIVLLAVTIA